MEQDNRSLLRMAQRDVQSLKLRLQRTEAPSLLLGVRNALHGAVKCVQRVGSSPAANEAVGFSTVPAPLLTDQLRNQLPKIRHPRLLRSDFTLPRVSVRGGAVPSVHSSRSNNALAIAQPEEDEDDLDDEEEDEDDVDEDDDVSLLSWHMLSSGSPVRAEPVSEGDEQLQFETIAAGNVPTIFVGRAYTNGAVNVIALHKMQKLLVCFLCFLFVGLLYLFFQESVA